jgi:hypothetical protein
MKMISSILIAAAIAILAPPLVMAKSPVVTQIDVTKGMQIGIGQCVSQTAPSKGIAAAVLPALISKGVNLLGNALSQAGQEKVWMSLGSRNVEFTNVYPACIQIVRGRFKTTEALSSAPPGFQDLSLPSTAYKQLVRNGIWISDKPDFFFEGAIITSENKNAIAIRPLHAALFSPQGKRAFRGDLERGVALFLAFSKPGERPDLSTNPGASIVLGQMSPNQTLRFDAGNASSGSTPYESPWFVLSETDARSPLTVNVMLAETQSGSEIFAFIASIFNDERVNKAVTDRANFLLVPGIAEAAKATIEQSQSSAATVADDKFGTVLAKLIECKKAGNDAVFEGVAARTALREYAAADAALSKPLGKIKAGMIDKIPLIAPSAIAKGCGDVYFDLTGENLP